MKPQNPILTITKTLDADIPARRFVGFNGERAGAGEKALGVLEVEAEIGMPAPINVLGVMLVETGGAIALGAEVTSNAEGRAVTIADDEACNGFAVDEAAGAGELIRIIRGI